MCFLGVRVLERRRRIGVEEECGVEGSGSAKDKVERGHWEGERGRGRSRRRSTLIE